MNDLEEKKVNTAEESDEGDVLRRRAAYRRGARDKIKGNFALTVVLLLFAALLIGGIIFVINAFVNGTAVNTKTETTAESRVSSRSAGFDSVISQYEILSNDTAVKEISGKKAVFNDGILSCLKRDLDGDGAVELFMINVHGENIIEMSVYENRDGECVREGYYVFTSDIFDISDEARSEIYISEKQYICIEKYDKDGKWEAEILEYDGGLSRAYKTRVTDGDYEGEKDELEEYGLSLCGEDYEDEDELSLNGGEGENILLCAFDTDGKKLEISID